MCHFLLTFGGEIANNSSGNTKNDRSPWSDESRGRSGSNQTRNGTGTPTDHRPLLRKSEIKNTPGHGREHGSDGGVPASHDSAQVGAEGRSTVESEPSKPKKNCAEGDERNIVRSEVQHHLLLSLAQNHGVCKGGETRSDLDGSTSSVIHNTIFEGPAVDVPYPAGNGAVYDGGPNECEKHSRNEATPLSDCTHYNGCCDGAELHLYGVSFLVLSWRGFGGTYLVESIEKFWHERRSR